MKISQDGINLIKRFEGCVLQAVWDVDGYSIGYGHHSGVTQGMTITQEQADAFLRSDITWVENRVNKYDSVYHWTQPEFDALCDYTYNIGSIDKLVDYGKRTKQEIADDMPNHNTAGGKVLSGLTKRRQAERTMFLGGETMTTYDKKSISDMIALAEECLDYLEKASGTDLGDLTAEGKIRNAGYNNYTIYWKWWQELNGTNWQTQPYCIAWVSLCFVRAFGFEKAKQLLQGNIYTYCPDAYNKFNKAGKTHSTPHVGDIVLFWNASLGRWAHAGLVVKILTNGYVTFEANTSSTNNSVVRNGGATTRKSYVTGDHKVIFLRPDYEAYGISTSEDPEREYKTYKVTTGQVGIKTLADLNVRKGPGTDFDIVGSVRNGTAFQITEKAFDLNGARWLHSEELGGWVSGKYLTGWIQEENGAWWYLLQGNEWYADTLGVIDGHAYLFNSAGYMVMDPQTVTLVPGKSGAVKLQTKTD